MSKAEEVEACLRKQFDWYQYDSAYKCVVDEQCAWLPHQHSGFDEADCLAVIWYRDGSALILTPGCMNSTGASTIKKEGKI